MCTYIRHTVERNVKDCHPFRFVHTKLHNGYKTNRGAPLNQNNYLLGWVHLQQTRKGLVINTLQQHCMKKVSVLLFYSEIDFAFFTFPWDVIVRALLCNPFWNAFIWNAYYHYGFGSICFDIFKRSGKPERFYILPNCCCCCCCCLHFNILHISAF